MDKNSPRKPIKRAAVPKVSKKVTSIETDLQNNGKVGENLLLLLLLVVVSGIIYTAIFQKEWLYKQFPSSIDIKLKKSLEEDLVLTDTLSEEDYEVSTFIGEQPDPERKVDKEGKVVYPAGSTFYLVSGTFVFKPYAIKFKAKMESQGYTAKIHTSDTERKYYRIYLEKSQDIKSMRTKRDEIRASTDLDVWILAN